MQKLSDQSYTPKIWVDIDIANQTVKVTDNGTGISAEQFRYLLKPNISFKKPREYRGQKGVGATFLAYGFSLLRVHTRQSGIEIAANLRQGRQWASDQKESVPRPKFASEQFTVPQLSAGESGTSVEFLLSGSAGERPKTLDWIGARTAEQWLDVLRIKTPLGGVYLNSAKFSPHAEVIVTDSTGHISKACAVQPEYFYPHEIPDYKVATVKDIEKALSAIPGSSEEKFTKLEGSYKRINIMWETYGTEELCSSNSPFESALNDDDRGLIERHQVVVYASFLRSAKMWGDLNDSTLKLKPGERLIHGGLQMASDFMPQGDLSIIPLTSTIGYQANSHIIIHFSDESPDMGRKVFQPELTKLAEKISVRCVTIFKRYLQHLKPDTGAATLAPDKELYDWRASQVSYRDKNALAFTAAGQELAIVSRPQQEQDVIALYHQLIGMGIIRGMRFYATSQSERYDSLYSLQYNDESFRYRKLNNPSGVNPTFNFPYHSEPRVLEYKYDLDALIKDFAAEI